MTSSGSLISAVLSFLPLSCCVFPVAFSFLGAGGLTFAMGLMPYRPYFIAFNLVFLGAGFYFAYRPQKEMCAPGTACATAKEPATTAGKPVGDRGVDRWPSSHSRI